MNVNPTDTMQTQTQETFLEAMKRAVADEPEMPFVTPSYLTKALSAFFHHQAMRRDSQRMQEYARKVDLMEIHGLTRYTVDEIIRVNRASIRTRRPSPRTTLYNVADFSAALEALGTTKKH